MYVHLVAIVDLAVHFPGHCSAFPYHSFRSYYSPLRSYRSLHNCHNRCHSSSKNFLNLRTLLRTLIIMTSYSKSHHTSGLKVPIQMNKKNNRGRKIALVELQDNLEGDYEYNFIDEKRQTSQNRQKRQ